MDEYDAIIIGSGPAGLMAGHKLKEGDSVENVLIIERRDDDSYGRYHRMCAEGISLRGFEAIGIPRDECVKNVIRSVREEWPDGIVLQTAIEGLIIDRIKVLSWLKDRFVRNGGEVLQAEVSSILPNKDGVNISLDDGSGISCRFLVGADGANSLVRRSVFRSEPEFILPVEQYIVEGSSRDDELLLRYDQRYKGKYWWRFPNGRNFRIGFPSGTAIPPDGYLERHGRSIPIGMVESMVQGRTALVGDAAGQANPLTFGGLHNSFAAAAMLARSIEEGDLRKYEDEWRGSEMGNQCFIETYRLIRDMSNQQLSSLVSPLRHGPNMTSVMSGLLNSYDFRTFYRSHVRKLSAGW